MARFFRDTDWVFPVVMLGVVAVGVFAVLFMAPKPHETRYTGFYYPMVAGRQESIEAILKTPKHMSEMGAFASVESCQNWADDIYARTQHAATNTDDLLYCGKNCWKDILGSGGMDCDYKEGRALYLVSAPQK